MFFQRPILALILIAYLVCSTLTAHASDDFFEDSMGMAVDTDRIPKPAPHFQGDVFKGTVPEHVATFGGSKRYPQDVLTPEWQETPPEPLYTWQGPPKRNLHKPRHIAVQ